MTTNQDEKRLTWQRHIEAWKSSGKTQQAYCDENNIRPNQMWYWNRQLRPKTTADTTQAAKQKHKGSAFVPVQIDPCDVHGQGLNIALPNGLVIQGITPQTLPWLNHLIREVS